MPPVKLFISSEFKRDGTYSNFSFQLPRPVDVGKQYRALVDQIHIPHVFPTITANNRALYFEEVYDDDQDGVPTTRQRKVLLDEGQYSGDQLATELQSKMQTGTHFTGATYAVTFDSDQGKLSFRVTHGGAVVRLLPMEYLIKNPTYFTGFLGEAVVEHDDCGSVIGLHGNARVPFAYTDQTPITLGHISVISHHVLYLHCDLGLGTGEDAVGPRGNGTILRSIPVTSVYGQMLHDMSLNPKDYTMVHKGQLNTFKFRLADKFGRDIDLDQPFSFSILLDPVDELE